mmetsp:Transcript_70044/g.210439  ORF Transcript_70044/g.210439 Transcript_70044/m.210439 type:complete len:562 (+) Transcript_70044:2078-3763(+)
MEAEEHAAEGIAMGEDAKFGAAADEVISLISARPGGLFAAVDEASSIDRTDKQMLQQLHTQFAKTRGYRKPMRGADDTFAINHYAGQVVYSVAGFIEHNKDDVGDTILALLESRTSFERLKALAVAHFHSRNEAEATLNAANKAAATKAKGPHKLKRMTIGREFGASMDELMAKLRASEAHYLRCIKPNAKLEPSEWDPSLVTRQLHYSGLLELAQMRKQHLSERRNLRGFCAYFAACSRDPEHLRELPPPEQALLLLDELGVSPDEYKVGKLRIFLTPAALQACKMAHATRGDERMQMLRSIVVVRSALRVWLKRRRAEMAFLTDKRDAEVAAEMAAEERAADAALAAAAASSGTPPPEATIKIIIVGDSNTGKTCLMKRFVEGRFPHGATSTVSVDVEHARLELGAQNVSLQLHDTAGQERFAALCTPYFRGADGVILAYDLTRPKTFERVGSFWRDEVIDKVGNAVPTLLVGCKGDLVGEGERTLPIEQVEAQAEAWDLMHFEVSAKTGDRVRDAFYLLACTVMNERLEADAMNVLPTHGAPTHVGGAPPPKTGGCGC